MKNMSVNQKYYNSSLYRVAISLKIICFGVFVIVREGTQEIFLQVLKITFLVKINGVTWSWLRFLVNRPLYNLCQMFPEAASGSMKFVLRDAAHDMEEAIEVKGRATFPGLDMVTNTYC